MYGITSIPAITPPHHFIDSEVINAVDKMDHNDKINTSKSLLSDTKAAVLSGGKVKITWEEKIGGISG